MLIVYNKYGRAKKIYIYGNTTDQPIEMRQYRENGYGRWHTVYYLYDGEGNVRQLTNSRGQVIASYNYLPFGEMMNKPQQITSPILKIVTINNSYIFVENNPINYKDPTGKQIEIIGIGWEDFGWISTISGSIYLEYVGYQCLKCISTAINYNNLDAEKLSHCQYQEWFKNVKPGLECSGISGTAITKALEWFLNHSQPSPMYE
jgi:hypothetical protein